MNSEPPKAAGFYWCFGVVPHCTKWELVRVFEPAWWKPERRGDLRWKYLDGSGGDDERYDIKGGHWQPVTPPELPKEPTS